MHTHTVSPELPEGGMKPSKAVSDYMAEIGRKGGHKVRDLIAAGKRAMERK